MSNYDMDIIERDRMERSLKQKEQLKNYGTDLPYVDDNTSRERLDRLKNMSKRRPLEKEEVTNPKYYNEMKVEPLDYIIANELDFLEGNIVKYITRYTYKGGVNDLLKARTYLERLIERERDGR